MKILAFLLALGVALCWSLCGVINKVALKDSDWLALNIVRASSACFFFSLPVFLRGPHSPLPGEGAFGERDGSPCLDWWVEPVFPCSQEEFSLFPISSRSPSNE
ncbi:hypothetical protein AKJ65_06605 [candidate division MSBL1 archaeon SCGC-AAA259E19]|uniref:Uncharacterized protein n=1 Tax=candidate division MSBL1 archaeon SCGC-AAA259E19 TaxID=1698264 RepID=A0A133UG52_9EURY|nr:hypothetical protein AKJ65_06605 [candidate division MSBL1 archaeon SCGC-AAA259E19]